MWLDEWSTPFGLVAAGALVAVIWSIEARQRQLSRGGERTDGAGSIRDLIPAGCGRLGRYRASSSLAGDEESDSRR